MRGHVPRISIIKAPGASGDSRTALSPRQTEIRP
jgi:hypothetical protein